VSGRSCALHGGVDDPAAARFTQFLEVSADVRVAHLFGNEVGGKAESAEKEGADFPEADMTAQEEHPAIEGVGLAQVFETVELEVFLQIWFSFECVD
jgi:hypothetical protein